MAQFALLFLVGGYAVGQCNGCRRRESSGAVLSPGNLAGVAIGYVTEYYTSMRSSRSRSRKRHRKWVMATNIIEGLATGFRSCAAPVLIICAAIFLAHESRWPLWYRDRRCRHACNRRYYHERRRLRPDRRQRRGYFAECAAYRRKVRSAITDELDSLGNTTAAIGEGIRDRLGRAGGLGALLRLYTGARQRAGRGWHGADLEIPLNSAEVVIGLLLGGILPFVIAALSP